MRFSVRVSIYLCSAVFLMVCAVVSPAITQGQTTASLSGTILDPRGAVIVGAQVSAEPISFAGQPNLATSSESGSFALTLPPGQYRVVISQDSFVRTEQEITLAPGETRELQFRMAIEPLSAKVIVTAQTIPQEAESSPAPVSIVTREQIDQRVATSLPDLLVTLPGFSLGRTGSEGGTTSLFLDGGNSNYTKVLVDGAPVNQPGGLVDFSFFTIENVEKIEVVHGAVSALYGSDAMSGVIQVFTRRGTTRIPEFRAFADGGNFSTGRGGADLSGLLGRFDYAAAFADLQTEGQDPNNAYRNRMLSGNFGWRFSDSARAGLSLRDNVSAAGLPGPTALPPYQPRLTDSIGLHNFSAILHTEFTTGSHWHHQLNGTEYYYRQISVSSFGPTRYQYNRARFAGQSAFLTRTFSITAGYEYEVENGFISYLGLHVRRNNQAGFLDVRWQPIARLTLNAGARAEANDNFGTRVVPRVGAAYALRVARGTFGDTRLRASYGQGIVEPKFDQTFGTDPCYPGNPNLSPERSRTVHAGVEQKLMSDRVRLTADYFDNRFRNVIGFLYDPNFCGTYFNINLTRARGVNLSGEARLTRWLSAAANYMYDSTRTLSAPTDPVNIDPNYLVGRSLLRRPVNSGNAMLNASFWRMNWNVSGYFTGRRADYDYPNQSINPGYARFDLAASYKVGRGVSFYGRIANLADKQYQEAYGYPALGREFRIGVKYTTHPE